MSTTSTPVTVTRRTFEAAQHPKGSEERARLNTRAETSEYYPSMRYVTSNGQTFRLKRDAEEYAAGMRRTCDDCGAAPGEGCAWDCSSNLR